jgi:hypothetical protein
MKRFCSIVVRSRLLARSELEKHYRAWRQAKPAERDKLPGFIRYLVRHAGVTDVQIEQAMRSAGAVEDNAKDVLEVELIRVRDPERGLNRRDLVMLLSGAAAAAAAIIIPAMIARSIQPADSTPTE